MPDQFGGIPIGQSATTTDQFGGIPVGQPATTTPQSKVGEIPVGQPTVEPTSYVAERPLPEMLSVTPLGGGGAGVQLASYLGYSPYGEKKRAVLGEAGEVEITRADEIAASYDMNTTDIERWNMSLQALMPTPSYQDSEGNYLNSLPFFANPANYKVVSPRERYGDDFIDASYGTRMEILKAERAAGIKDEHALTYSVQEEAGEDATAAVIGAVSKELSTPTVLAPLGRTLKQTAGLGAAVAGQLEASRQAVGDKEFDPLAIGTEAAKGAGLSLLLGAPIRTAAAVSKGVYQPTKAAIKASQNATENLANKVLTRKALKKPEEGATAAANKLIIKMEQKFDEKVIAGVPKKDIAAQTQAELGLNPEQVLTVLANGTRTPKINTAKVAAQNLQLRSNPLISRTIIGKQFDYIAEPITQSIKKISEPMFGALRRFEYDTHANVAQSNNTITPFLRETSRIRNKEKDPAKLEALSSIDRDLQSGRFLSAARTAEANFPTLAKQLVAQGDQKPIISTLLNDIHNRAKAVGIKVGYLENFWPRAVKDLEGLKQAVGSELKTPIERALNAAAKKEGITVAELDDDLAAEVISKVLQKKNIPTGQKRVEAQRVISEITPQLQGYYHDASTSLALYVERMEREIAKRQFFAGSKATVLDKAGNVDLDKSIARMLVKQRKDNNINPVDEENLRLLLLARFETGEQAMGTMLAKARDLQTMSLLAQFDSAAIQLGDIGSSMYANGLSNTIKALATGTRNARVTPDDLGVINKVSAEVNTMDGWSKAVDKTLKLSLFSGVDRLGKRVFLDAAYRKATQLAQKNPTAIAQKYGKVYGDETEQLIKDLQQGKVTDNVKLYLWNELSDVQPISLSEMPRGYLENPNGRIFYALKSFGLKQLSRVRQDILDEARKGNTKAALENATRYVLMMGGTGATVEETRQFIRGGLSSEAMTTDVSTPESIMETFPDAVYETLMKVAFLGKYQRERYLESGQVGKYVAGLVMPASLGIADTVGAAAMGLTEEEVDIAKVEKAGRSIPIFGRLYYYLLGGGVEETVEKAQALKQKELRDESLRKAM